MTNTTRTLMAALAILAVTGIVPTTQGRDATQGPVGPSPYDVVSGWHKSFADDGYAFGGNSGVFAESPDRIFIAQRGEARLPSPIPPEFAGYAGSIGINVLRDTDRRVWRNCLYTLDAGGRVSDLWDQWDHLCEGSDGPGPHRVRISPYDPERRVWRVNETFHQIYVFSNDGRKLLKTLGEKRVSGDDETHFGRPQDVAFLPDGRVLVADGLDNHRVVILDSDGTYISEFGGHGEAPGQFDGIRALGVGPNGLFFALDRSGGRVNVFRTTDDPATVDVVGAWEGFTLPLDIIVNDDALWMTDLGPLRFIKLDFEGNHLYTWKVPRELPDGYLEVHTISVDSDGNLYGGDNQPVRSNPEVRAETRRGSGAADRPAVGRGRTVKGVDQRSKVRCDGRGNGPVIGRTIQPASTSIHYMEALAAKPDAAAARGEHDARLDYEIIVIGAGFSGIGAAIKLQQARLDDFVILEQATDLGWHLAGQHLSRCCG